MPSSNDHSDLTVHGYFRSSCTGRLRIALLLKEIEYRYIFVDFRTSHHMTEEYAQINPSRSVPSLIVAGKEAPITQSLAALEYLEEAYPEKRALLPKDTFQRAQVRALANIIVSDVQPVTNSKIMKKVGELGYDGAQWARDYHAQGLTAFEAIIRQTAGEYCFGDEITMADVCLTPAMWNAERYHLDLEPFPTVRRVYENANKVPAFQKGHWKNAPECPEDLK